MLRLTTLVPRRLAGRVARSLWRVLAPARGVRARPLPEEPPQTLDRPPQIHDSSPLATSCHPPLRQAIDERSLRQATPTTCGSASLVVARMLLDPRYCDAVLTSDRPSDGFAAAEQAVKRRTNGVRRTGGGLQLPWPPALGTPPWGVAAEMTSLSAEAGVRFTVRPVDSESVDDRLAALHAVRVSVLAGRPAPIFVGDGLCPRHVVLVTAATADGVEVYEPAGGTIVEVPSSAFAEGRLSLAGWDHVWAVVVPGRFSRPRGMCPDRPNGRPSTNFPPRRAR